MKKLLVLLLFFTTYAQGEIKVGIIGKGSDHICDFIRHVNENKEGLFNDFNIVAFCPAFSYENEQNAGTKVSGQVKKLLEDYQVSYVSTTRSLLEQADYIILESYNGLLDFNSAFEVLKAKKLLYMQQPEQFELSDMIMLFALSKKYLAIMDTYTTSAPLETVATHFNYNFKMVSTSSFNNQCVTLIHTNLDTIGVINNMSNSTPNNNLYYLAYEKIENIQPIDHTNNKLFNNIYQMFTTKKTLLPEEKSLNLATLIFSIQKSKEQEGKNMFIDDLYQQAFDTAFEKMRLYN